MAIYEKGICYYRSNWNSCKNPHTMENLLQNIPEFIFVLLRYFLQNFRWFCNIKQHLVQIYQVYYSNYRSFNACILVPVHLNCTLYSKVCSTYVVEKSFFRSFCSVLVVQRLPLLQIWVQEVNNPGFVQCRWTLNSLVSVTLKSTILIPTIKVIMVRGMASIVCMYSMHSVYRDLLVSHCLLALHTEPGKGALWR